MLDVLNKLCLVTGGSSGLGLSLSTQLAQRGAHICVISRREKVLESAVEEIKKHRVNDDQHVISISADCTNFESIQNAVNSLARRTDLIPSLVICCVGKAIPKLFLDHSTNEFEDLMQCNYFSALYTIQAVLPLLLREPQPSHILLVSSLAAFVGFAGYSAYSPPKAALKALSDTLRHELLETQVKIHTFFPGNFESPGYEEELLTKPKITKYLDEQEPILTAQTCAKYCLQGLDRNEFQITSSFNGDLIRCTGQVHAPANHFILDFFKCVLGFIILGIWRYTQLDREVAKNPLYKKTSIEKSLEPSKKTK
ncbi:3-dehydrosphinganine reductase [Coelomomyces lativittatus]|nr:3-dehydrosphinganine reductase [Coelomomyces lativittatus]KAJ1502231.1 3-dehydrosphinganine reductase [Coelomomyces lativittatus]KAJ1514299.1 3-dehydrosphinganine reductase [Coelomomyces lativittatus]